MKIERRITDGMRLEKREGQAGPGTLTGYAALYNSRSVPIMGLFTETIAPGAFRNTLAANPDVRALWNHDSAIVLGRSKAGTLRMVEDAKGLRVEIDLPATQAGRDAAVSVERGDVSQMSFGFRVPKGGDSWRTVDGGEERTLTEIDIHNGDVSPVAFPAYPETEIALTARSAFEERSASLAAAADLARMDAALMDAQTPKDAAPAPEAGDAPGACGDCSHCTKCGTEIPEGSSFCPGCGAKVVACPACGCACAKGAACCACCGSVLPA